MHRMWIIGIAGVVVLGGVVAAGAAGVPWKKDDAKKEEKAEDTGSVDLKSELNQIQYNRLIKPIEAKLEDVARIRKAYEKETAKPIGQQNPRRLLAFRQKQATYYLGASLAAKNAVNRLREDRLKNAVREQYQKPNEQKAIDIYLELAMKAQDEGSVRGAVAYYKRILKIDKENKEAKDALTRIAKELQQKRRTGSKSTGGGREDDEDGRPWERDDDHTGRNRDRNKYDHSRRHP